MSIDDPRFERMEDEIRDLRAQLEEVLAALKTASESTADGDQDREPTATPDFKPPSAPIVPRRAGVVVPPSDTRGTTKSHLAHFIELKRHCHLRLDRPPLQPPASPEVIASAIPSPTSDSSALTTIPSPTEAAKSEFIPTVFTAMKPTGLSPAPRNNRQKNKRTAPLELLIGGRGMAIAGGFVIILSVIALLKLGYDREWWGHISPLMRCLFAAGFGGALLVAGEIALRRISRFAALGLFGAGLGILYITAFATTWASMDVCDENTGFLLLAAVAILGVAVTIRGRLLAIGVLSILSGYSVILLVQPEPTFFIAFPLYLSLLLAVALLLSALMPAPFRPLRSVAVIAHLLIALGWLYERGGSNQGLGLLFMSGWWVMVMAELVYAAMRNQAARSNIAISIFVTAWYVTVACAMFGFGIAGFATVSWFADQTGIFTLAVGVIAVVIALQFGPGIDALRMIPRTAMDKLAVCLWCQGGVLVTTAAALHFSDFGQSISWLALAVLSIEAGRRIHARGVDIFGFVVGALALARIVLWDSVQTMALGSVVYGNSWITLTGWSFLMLGAIGAMLIIAHRLRTTGEKPWQTAPIVLMSLATIAWALWWLHASGSEPIAVALAWLVTVVLLIVLRKIGTLRCYLEIGMILHFGTLAYWLMAGIIGPRAASAMDFASSQPFINERVGLILLIVGVGVWVWRINTRENLQQAAGITASLAAERIALLALALVMVAFSFEIESIISLRTHGGGSAAAPIWPRVLHVELWLTLFWASAGGALTVAGIARKHWSIIGRAGWILLSITAMFWLIFDTVGWRGQLGQPIRAAVFFNLQFGVGAAILIMFTVCHWYSVRCQTNVFESTFLDQEGSRKIAAALPMIALLGFWLGSFEIDRFFHDSAMARQTSWSIYWGIYAIGLVSFGFFKKAKAARLAGLILLSVTAVKVLSVDMAQVEMIYRTFSLAGVGMLMVITSVTYAKFAGRLLGEELIHDADDSDFGEDEYDSD